MITRAVQSDDLSRSVWAVPPLALRDGKIADAENRKLVDHICGGGVSTILWGGNANIYNHSLEQFRDLMSRIPDWVGPDVWAIPSVGPDFGRLQDHAEIIKRSKYPAVLALPFGGPCDPQGVESALRRFVDKSGVPVIPYLRRSGYLRPDQLAGMLEDGVAVAIKYAIEPPDLSNDPDLAALIAEVDPKKVVSGIGEIAALDHLPTYGLGGFTAGAVCIAPKRAMRVLAALKAGDVAKARADCGPINALEYLRQEYGPIPVIHTAVTGAGIANMGEISPMFSMPPSNLIYKIEAAAKLLLEEEKQ